MTVALASYSPSTSTAKLNDTVTFKLTDTSDLYANKVTLSLTDEHGTSYASITTGTFLVASGWAGSITVNNTGATKTCHVVIDRHPDFVSGEWTAAVTYNSASVGSWTFEIVDILSGVLCKVRDLLEGTAGSARTIPTNTFRHVDSRREAITSISGAGPVQPFTLALVGPGDQDPQGYTICGDYTISNWVIRITIAHAMRDQALLEFEQDRARDDYYIRHCLQWPNNWALAVGWLGADLTGPTFEPVEDDEGRSAVLLSHYDLDCTIREHHP